MTIKTETFAFNMPLDFITRYNTKTFEQLKASSTDTVGFVTKRLQEDMALPQKLMSCKQPMDAMEVWADFYKAAFSDYSEQSQKMFGLMEQAAEEGQAVAKDMAEAGESVLKQVDAKVA